jgi:tRNA 2-thiouridine synthesizing protein A
LEADAPAGAAEIYDLRGLTCPLPVLKAKKRLSGMKAGSLLWLETTDPLAVIDVPVFCRESGHRLMETERICGGHRFLVERSRPASS